MSFDDLSRDGLPDKSVQRTPDQHCHLATTENLKLNMVFDARRLVVVELGRSAARAEHRGAKAVPFLASVLET
jgi:hypothetical protein